MTSFIRCTHENLTRINPLFDMGFFEQSVMGGHNFFVIALMVMKFGTDVKLDVF